MSTSPYLTPDETVAYLGLPSRNALKQRMKRKTIPAWCWTRMGGSLRFVRASLDEWLQPTARLEAARSVAGSPRPARVSHGRQSTSARVSNLLKPVERSP